MVNPRACKELSTIVLPATTKKKIAVVGAGPAGLSASVTLAQRGHEVHLFEAQSVIGGQFNIAKEIPGKEEFIETLRYYKKQMELHKVQIHLNSIFKQEQATDFDEVVVSTGVIGRNLSIEGINDPKVLTYTDVVLHKKPVGKKVAIIGAGGIGFDVAEFLTNEESNTIPTFMEEWGVDMNYTVRGAIQKNQTTKSPREVYLLQRSKGKLGSLPLVKFLIENLSIFIF